MRPEMFVRKGTLRNQRGVTRPEISIQKQGRLGLNPPALAMLGIEPGADLILYWYADAGQIGMRPAKDGDPPMARFRVGKNRIINAKPLFERFGIDVDRARGRYSLGVDSANALHLFQLPREARPQPARPVGSSALAERLQKVG